MLGRARVTKRLLVAAGVAAAVPDIDAIGRPFHAGDVALLGGHRAVTHSVFFAIGVGVLAALLAARHRTRRDRWLIGVFFALVVLSHGVLDAFTPYGEGIAFFAPLSMTRWKAAWQPFSGLIPEVLVLWLPALLVYRLWFPPRRIQSSRPVG